jgi:hypothetical protein
MFRPQHDPPCLHYIYAGFSHLESSLISVTFLLLFIMQFFYTSLLERKRRIPNMEVKIRETRITTDMLNTSCELVV